MGMIPKKKNRETATVPVRVFPSTHKILQKLSRERSHAEDRFVSIPEIIRSLVLK